MKVDIHTLGNTKQPTYATEGSVAFDIAASTDTTIPARQLGKVPTGLIIHVPEGYALLVLPRSSTPKRGLMIPHGVGVIDRDYCGPDDEILLLFYNYTDEDVVVKAGDRLGQGLFVPVEQAQWVGATPAETSRGGFGSTG